MHLRGLIFVQGIFMLLNEGGQFVLLSTMSLPCRGLAKKVLDLEHVSRSATAETSHPSGQTVEETSLQLFRIGLSFCFLCENRCNMFSFSTVFFLHFLFSYFCFFFLRSGWIEEGSDISHVLTYQSWCHPVLVLFFGPESSNLITVLPVSVRVGLSDSFSCKPWTRPAPWSLILVPRGLWWMPCEKHFFFLSFFSKKLAFSFQLKEDSCLVWVVLVRLIKHLYLTRPIGALLIAKTVMMERWLCWRTCPPQILWQWSEIIQWYSSTCVLL